jgi:hypothetical protein
MILKVKVLSTLLLVSCGYYSVGYLSDPDELLNMTATNRTEAMFRFVFLLATLLAVLAASGLYRLRKWSVPLGMAGGLLLSLHLGFVLADSFSISTISELPAAIFSLFFWLMLYSADLLGPMLLVVLTKSSVRALLH